MKWVYEETPPNGGAPGDAFKSIFNGSGKGSAETLAREAIQNSVDAAVDPAGSVRIDFRFCRLDGPERNDFEVAAALDEMRPREPVLGLPRGNLLIEESKPLDLLYIDDYETVGLKGDPSTPSSNLRKLLMDLGGSDKAHMTDGSGGSYGFGKAVYSSSSGIGIIFVFSETTNEAGEPITLLMGCAYHEGHKYGGSSFTGRAWFGIGSEVAGKGIRYDPFEGEAARELATKLGFVREGGEKGTSILVIDVGLEPADVLAGMEDWWWPRIQLRLLETSVFDCSGVEWFPMPKKRRHLKPFIDAFDSAAGRTPDISGKIQRKRFNAMGELQLGHLGAVVLDDSDDENPLGEEYENRLSSVALVRGPLMVVDYHRNWYPSASAPLAAGCFLADSDIDFLLKLSEPPEHSRWDPGASRLLKQDEDAPRIVERVLRIIKKTFRDFQNAARPPAPPRPRRLAKLERDLASWFGVGPNGNNCPPGPGAAPISLRPEGPHLSVEGELLCARGSVEIDLADKDGTARWFRVRLGLQVAEEDGVSAADPVPLHISSDASLEKIDNGFLLGRVDPQSTVRIDYVSEPYDAGWTVRLLPEVLPVEEEITQ